MQLGCWQAYLKTGDSASVAKVCQNLLGGVQHFFLGGYGCDFKISYADGMLLRKNIQTHYAQDQVVMQTVVAACMILL